MTPLRLCAAAAALALVACGDDDGAEAPPPVRGLVTHLVSDAGESIQRRYPGVLEPSSITALSFEVGGRLGEVTLNVGQRVSAGDVLAQLDDEQFRVAIEIAEAAVREAQAIFEQERDDLARQETLLARGVVTRVARDDARTDFRTASAQLDQAKKSLESAAEDLEDATLAAPFDGVINAVEADSFQTVASGTTVASLYNADAFEVSFSVNFDSISQLVVGTPAQVRLADNPSITLDAVVSELGDRADTVSSFPVVVALRERNAIIRAGMAVEVSLEFALQGARGFVIPLSAAITEGDIPEGTRADDLQPVEMYVFDPDASAVRRRSVMMAGIRGNNLLIVDGLAVGERVAIAGVSFLRDGMPVKLLPAED